MHLFWCNKINRMVRMDLKTGQICWDVMRKVFQEQIPEMQYNNWIKPLEVFYCDNRVLVFKVKDAVLADIIRRRYMPSIDAMSPQYFHVNFDKVLVFDELGAIQFKAELENSMLNRKFTFESFVTGPSNILAYSASLAVAEAPGADYNPLFLYGGAGLGKTHLMTAIANYALDHNNKLHVAFYSSEKFTNEVVDAIRLKKMPELRQNLRSLDILFIDDIQFLANREATQEEFFNTFNDLHSKQKQIVLSSDRPPEEIPALEERMRSRFKNGIIMGIDRPDFETRSAILRSKAEHESIDAEDDALILIAHEITSNIRELEGALKNAAFLANVKNNGKVTVDIAEEALKNVRPAKNIRRATAPAIIYEVARHYGVTKDDILSSKRSREVIIPRQLAMYLTRELCGASTTRIGDEFGRDHSTVMHALSKAEELMKDSRDFCAAAEEIKRAF